MLGRPRGLLLTGMGVALVCAIVTITVHNQRKTSPPVVRAATVGAPVTTTTPATQPSTVRKPKDVKKIRRGAGEGQGTGSGGGTGKGTRWLKPVSSITPVTSCNLLSPGMNGVKVKIVQRELGMPASSWETMDAATRKKVRAFQSENGLNPTGTVNPRTWKALGVERTFCSYDRWQTDVAVADDAGPRRRIGQMIAHARTYLGREYVWGGNGAYGEGIDCSGLVLQGLYSAGLDPQPITFLKHPLPEYRTSLELYRHSKLRHFPRSNAKRGDLVFWKNNDTGRVNHVAIYLGGGNTLEASGAKVHIDTLRNRSTQTMMPTVVRPFT
jgi:cell wall-associated NlpC family hydrolase